MSPFSIVIPCLAFDAPGSDRDMLLSRKRWLETAEMANKHNMALWAWCWLQPRGSTHAINHMRALLSAAPARAIVLNAEMKSTLARNWSGTTAQEAAATVAALRDITDAPVYLSTHGYPKSQMPSAALASHVDGVTPQAYNSTYSYLPINGVTFSARCRDRWQRVMDRVGNKGPIFMTTGVNSTGPTVLNKNIAECKAVQDPALPILIWGEGGLSRKHTSVLQAAQ
jgi:hypothetical protein